MEKKKLLLVAVSVGVFLTIVVGASILIFKPRTGGTVVSAPKPIPAGTAGGSVRVDAPLRTQPATVDAAEMVRNADSIQGLQQPPAFPAPIQESDFYIGNEGVQPEAAVAAAPAEKPRESSSDTLVISVPKPSAAAVPESSAAPPRPAAGSPSAASRPATAAKPAPASASSAAKPAPAAARKPAAGTKPSPASASSAAKPAPASRPAAAAKPPKTQQDYWVQTGAFSAKIRAEGAKETLADKGITSIIDDREVDGKTWYRVRVGPYTSETEARYWLALVQSIDGFDGSQVRNDPR
jgi:DedD protein